MLVNVLSICSDDELMNDEDEIFDGDLVFSSLGAAACRVHISPSLGLCIIGLYDNITIGSIGL